MTYLPHRKHALAYIHRLTAADRALMVDVVRMRVVHNISVSTEDEAELNAWFAGPDRIGGSDIIGGIARHPDNHADRWYVNAAPFTGDSPTYVPEEDK